MIELLRKDLGLPIDVEACFSDSAPAKDSSEGEPGALSLRKMQNISTDVLTDSTDIPDLTNQMLDPLQFDDEEEEDDNDDGEEEKGNDKDDAVDSLGGGACPYPYSSCVRRMLTRLLLSNASLTPDQCYQRIINDNLGPKCMGACQADQMLIRKMRRNRRYLALIKGQVHSMYPMLV